MLAVEASALAAALTSTRVGRSHLAILSGVRLIAADGNLALWRSDLTLTVEAWVPCSKGDLDVVVPADMLTRYVQQVDGPLAFGMVENRLAVEARSSNVQLPVMNVHDWPLVEHTDGDAVVLDGDAVAAIRTVKYGANPSDPKPILGGVHFTGERVESTDSYRMAYAPCGVPECLVPVGALDDLEPGLVTVTDRSVTIEAGTTRRTVRTIEGEYPDTTRLATHPRPDRLRADRAALIAAVKVAQVAALTEKGDMLPISLTPDGDHVTVAARGVEAESAARVAAECTFEYRLGFNGAFLLDLLNGDDAETVEIEVTDALKPVLAYGAHGSEHVLMPVWMT